MVIIRCANNKDLSAIFDLYEKADWGRLKYLNSCSLNDVCDIKQGKYLLVAEDLELKKIVGTVQLNIIKTFGYNGKPYGVVEFLTVEEGFRRRGIGKALMEEVERICNSWNCFCVMLSSRNNRKEAHKFYRKLGFNAPFQCFRKNFIFIDAESNEC